MASFRDESFNMSVDNDTIDVVWHSTQQPAIQSILDESKCTLLYLPRFIVVILVYNLLCNSKLLVSTPLHRVSNIVFSVHQRQKWILSMGSKPNTTNSRVFCYGSQIPVQRFIRFKDSIIARQSFCCRDSQIASAKSSWNGKSDELSQFTCLSPVQSCSWWIHNHDRPPQDSAFPATHFTDKCILWKAKV